MSVDFDLLETTWNTIQEFIRSGDSQKLLVVHQRQGLLDTYINIAQNRLIIDAPLNWQDYQCPHYYPAQKDGNCEILQSLVLLHRLPKEICPFGQKNQDYWAFCPIRRMCQRSLSKIV